MNNALTLEELMYIRLALLKAPLPMEQTYPVVARIDGIIAAMQTERTNGPASEG